MAALGDLSSGAFQEINSAQVVVSVAMACFWKRTRNVGEHVAIRPFSDATLLQVGETARKRAATLCALGKTTFNPIALKLVPEWPLVYWWNSDILQLYRTGDLVGEAFAASKGLCTGDDTRFIRKPWEVCPKANHWKALIKGSKGKNWIEPLSDVVSWISAGLVFRVMEEMGKGTRFQGRKNYFKRGIAFSMIGSSFSARVHYYDSIFGNKGSSVFPKNLPELVCMMNSSTSRTILEALNPGIGFEVGDVNRLPVFSVDGANRIFERLEAKFIERESHVEPSVEFKHPGPSPWRYAQEWAQTAVDRAECEPLPDYLEQLDPEPPTDHLSFEVGVALGRFDRKGEGIRDPTTDTFDRTLPNGILFLDGSLGEGDDRDGLGHRAAAQLHAAWAEYGPKLNTRKNLRQWLMLDFFKSVHKDMYENRPIHWPISSKSKTFVAFINIHRWNSNTLRSLLADHLQTGALPRLDGELEDLRANRGDKDTDARFAKVKAWKEELDEFIAMVKQCSEQGPPPTDEACPKREVDARYDPDLDDGVMINSAALWPLLEPQWKDPKKWWKRLALANPKGNKDYDWSHLAMRYWPTRVDEKCQADPSLGVAHGCFWKYHPARAWAWELRLQDEIAPDFRIEEQPYPAQSSPLFELRDKQSDGGDAAHRAAYLRDEPLEAIAAIEKEVHRRRKDADGKILRELTILEPGLWSAEPEACWDMETRIIKKQEFGFRLIAPDEESARAKLLKETPQKATGRNTLLQNRGGDSGYLVGWQEAVE